MGYGLDGNGLIPYADEKGRKLPTIPESTVVDVLALVHTLRGHAGVGATFVFILDHFH